MVTGTVKWFNQSKGYGFIQPDRGGEDAFVHITTVRKSGFDTLQQGQKINYESKDNHGRSAAINLQ
ncbi:cold-shock protein [Candidatus Finniella inopinata]|uniref:Cold-shock protein n=1 Tax=Candidatus Finniella inopinata TaxID=1696036 RepID=A0A4Q7DKD5_9PROT|nr:cold-shock protein [Candidatus Finniella inopinata]RZI46534.1 cold-shock protein [Candidatus Finniella inopinata]